MPTLYVENVPTELYSALRERARQHRKSIASEVLSLLEENIVTPAELKSRKRFLRELQRLRSKRPLVAGPFSSTEDMLRADRSR